MSELRLRCRCGWSQSFGRDQLGLEISCPSCGRSFPIVDDPAEFTNRNVGAEDFRFAESTEDEVEPVVGPTGEALSDRRGAAPRRGAGGSRGVPTRRSHTPSRRKARETTVRRRTGVGPLPWVLAAVVIASVVILGFVGASQREQEVARGARLGERVAEEVGQGLYTRARSAFESGRVLDRLESELEPIRKELTSLRFEAGPVRVPKGRYLVPKEMRTIHDHVAKPRGYRLGLTLARRRGSWKVVDYELRRLTPAELTGRSNR